MEWLKRRRLLMRSNSKTSTPKKQVTKERYGLFLFDYISSSRVVTGDSLAGAKFFPSPLILDFGAFFCTLIQNRRIQKWFISLNANRLLKLKFVISNAYYSETKLFWPYDEAKMCLSGYCFSEKLQTNSWYLEVDKLTTMTTRNIY